MVGFTHVFFFFFVLLTLRYVCLVHKLFIFVFFQKFICNIESETVHQSVNVNCDVDDNINNEKANEPPSINNEENEVQKESKKAKTCRSEVGKYFSKVGLKDGKEKAKCNAFGQAYVVGGTKIGNSTLLRHLKKNAMLA